MVSSIDLIFEMLSWKNEKEIQIQGIEEAKKIKHLSVLIMPSESKDVWENCARVLISKNDQELKRYLIDLFKWLQDMNWPGAYLIYDRLKEVSIEEIEIAFKISMISADKLKDYSWQQALKDFYIDKMQKKL